MDPLPSHLYIGRVCKRGHEHEGGGSLRRRDNKDCLACMEQRQRDRSAAGGPKHYLGRLCKHGHDHEGSGQSLRNWVSRQCLECVRVMMAERRKDPAVRVRDRADSARWHRENKDDPGRKAAAIERATAWAKANPDRQRKRHREYMLQRRREDPQFATICKLRNRLRTAFRSARLGKRMRASKYGIDWQAVVDHLGPQPGPGYEVDHITPLSAFDLSDPAQVKEACRPENHQWLTQFENRSKGGVRRAGTN